MTKDKKNYNILVIEDNYGDFVLVSEYIEETIVSPNIVYAKNFTEGKALLEKETDSYFDVLLLDLSLPDIGKDELITTIVDICESSPIIVLTGYTDFDFSIKSLSLGISDYLLKDDLTGPALYKSIVYNIERNKIISDLATSEAKYSEMFHMSPEPMWVIDDKNNNQIIDANQAAIDKYQFTLEEFLNSSFNSLLVEPTNDSEDVDAPLILNLALLKTKSGQLVKADLRKNDVNYNNINAQLILAHDITDRLNYISAIEEQNKKLREISWIQSHVVRAPVARLMGIIQLLKEDDNTEEQKTFLFESILKSAFELDDIIKDITLKAEQINLKAQQDDISTSNN